MFKNVILIQVDSILGYPPTVSLINELSNIGCNVTVLTTLVNEQLKNVLPPSVVIVNIGEAYTYKTSPLNKFQQLFIIRKNIWKYIDQHYDNDTLLWVMSNITIKHMGMRLLKYRYNLHLFELVERVTYMGRWTFGLNLAKIAHHAHRVIVCEYNRAHITRTWFKLPTLPLIVSNKPIDSKIERNSEITKSDKAKELIENLKDKKIILYQGVVDAERPIEPIAEAVETLGDEYVFLVMTGNNCDNLKKYTRTVLLPYITAPYHLEVTSHAFIGILIYTPVYGSFTSPLNSIYCAPNKLFEFSQFGIPMLGNDIPGLKYTIEYNHMGRCLQSLDSRTIRDAINDISAKYQWYSENALSFNNSDNKLAVIKEAIMQ